MRYNIKTAKRPVRKDRIIKDILGAMVVHFGGGDIDTSSAKFQGWLKYRGCPGNLDQLIGALEWAVKNGRATRNGRRAYCIDLRRMNPFWTDQLKPKAAAVETESGSGHAEGLHDHNKTT